MNKALILFGHGARDPRWAAPFERLCDIVRMQLPAVKVELAFLELMTPRLPELVGQLVQDNYQEVTVVPVFFGQGGHVLRDLPVIIEDLKRQYPNLQLRAVPAVGEDNEVLNAIAHYCIGHLAGA